MIKNVILIMVAFAVVALQGLAQPKLSIGNDKPQDFGDVNLGSKLTHEVFVKNIGKDTLHIDNVKAQCGCTATLLSNNTVPPRDSAKLTVTFNSANYQPGKVTKHVYITSNDTTANKTYTLEFIADVITPLMVDPGFFSYPNAKVDSVYSKSLTLTNKSKSVISIDSLTGNTEQITFKVGKTTLQPGEQTTIEGVLHPVKAGSYQGIFSLHTNIPDQKKMDIRYLAWINRK